ncbi:hypothetical protein HNY73_019796 [Argiope bruennichi]|uniref:Uncharacterized protein n=1 Tax=Argiope bruennichi TaxID=94029 RepID=A0A8T0E4Q8_ARGBR|nr:hypothetical protein HNY73_019796 [Argiope bruennichi]
MSLRNSDFGETLVFAEDLICDFFKKFEIHFNPTTGGEKYRNPFRRIFNEDILWVVCFFSHLPTKPCYEMNYFPRGYSVLDFLHFCGKKALEALRDVQNGITWAGDYAILSITFCLTQFMLSGEFERNGGWFELKEVSSKLCKFHVFCSVVCIGNRYVQTSGENGENAINGCELAALKQTSGENGENAINGCELAALKNS